MRDKTKINKLLYRINNIVELSDSAVCDIKFILEEFLSDKEEEPWEKEVCESFMRGLPVLDEEKNEWIKEYKAEFKPPVSDKTIIKHCLDYAYHRMTKHHTAGIPSIWLKKIDELRKGECKYCGLPSQFGEHIFCKIKDKQQEHWQDRYDPSRGTDTYKQQEPKGMISFNGKKSFFDKKGDKIEPKKIERIGCEWDESEQIIDLTEKMNEIIDYLNNHNNQ